jgi:hypothetical protein
MGDDLCFYWGGGREEGETIVYMNETVIYNCFCFYNG